MIIIKNQQLNIKKQLLNIAVLILLLGITFYVIFTNSDGFSLESLGNFIKGIYWPCLIGAFVCMIMNIGFKGLSIRSISRHLGYKRRLSQNYSYASADIYFSAITPSATGGQPASLYYMVKDGIPIAASTAILSYNLLMYTASLIVIAVLAFAINPSLFMQFEWWAKALIIAGTVVQAAFLAVYVMILVSEKVVLKIGGWLVSLLCFFRVFKDKEKSYERLENAVKRFKGSIDYISRDKKVAIKSFLYNLLERIAYLSIGVLVFFGAKMNMPELASVNISVMDVFVLQAYCLLGSYCVPLPGAVGASEGLFSSIFYLIIPNQILLTATMLTTRAINFYICFMFAGVVTVVHHIGVTFFRKNKEESTDSKETAKDKEKSEQIKQ